MSNENHTAKSGGSSTGIGFTGLLTVAFIVLKLCGVIQWSWWWVLSPIWISCALLTIAFIVIVILFRHDKKDKVKKRKDERNKV